MLSVIRKGRTLSTPRCAARRTTYIEQCIFSQEDCVVERVWGSGRTGERGSSPFPGQPMGREPRWAGGQDSPHYRPTQGSLRVCSARGGEGGVGRKNQRAGLPLASADSCLLSRCFHFFSLAYAHGFQSRDLTFATYSHCDHRYGMTLL